jgi:hypothetical protein
MGIKHSAVGNLKFYEGSGSEIFSSIKHRQEPSEDTPMYIMDEKMRSSFHAFHLFCTNRLGRFIAVAWVLSFCCGGVSCVLYSFYASTIWMDSDILCVSIWRTMGMIGGIIWALLFVVGLVYWIRELFCGRLESRELFIIRFGGASSFWLLFISLTALFSFIGAPMLIKSPNNAVYHCGFYLDAHLILVWPDQNCEFWPKKGVCDVDIRNFLPSNWTVVVNGTPGVYYCKTQSSEGLNHCWSRFNGFSRFMYWGMAFSVVACIFSIISVCLIENEESSTPCTECFGRCPCCKHNTCCESVDKCLFPDLHQGPSSGPM